MAKRRKQRPPTEDTELSASANPLAKLNDGVTHLERGSPELIHEAVMRGGGEPFGEPFAYGTPSLTERIVKLFNLRGFFGFETFEKTRQRRNKFTRYGASRYRGTYRAKKQR